MSSCVTPSPKLDIGVTGKIAEKSVSLYYIIIVSKLSDFWNALVGENLTFQWKRNWGKGILIMGFSFTLAFKSS